LRFEWYTEKTVQQVTSAINERLHSKPSLEGWIEKGGRFSVATSCTIGKRFMRRTRLHAEAKRDDGYTVIRGDVPSGVTRNGLLVIYAVVALVAVVMVANGNAMFGILALLAGVALYIPLTGDYQNSAVLMREVRSALKARDRTPTKKSSQSKVTARRR